MTNRIFKVLTSTTSDNIISEFIVTDMSEDELKIENDVDKNDWRSMREKVTNDKTRPRVATFPVSQLYDKHEQSRRANMFADYLNKIQAATDKAVANTTLIDTLSMKQP